MLTEELKRHFLNMYLIAMSDNEFDEKEMETILKKKKVRKKKIKKNKTHYRLLQIAKNELTHDQLHSEIDKLLNS